jgi:hypothetical protein
LVDMDVMDGCCVYGNNNAGRCAAVALAIVADAAMVRGKGIYAWSGGCVNPGAALCRIRLVIFDVGALATSGQTTTDG